MLAAAPGVAYVHEPFNVDYPPGEGVCRVRFPYWYTAVTAENERLYRDALRDTVALRYSLGAALRAARSARDLRRCLDEYRRYRDSRGRGATALVKDPLAFFSAEWLASRFDMSVVVVVRHPAAFASSLVKLNWTHPFSHFVEQPVLMRDLLRPFADEIRAFSASERPVLDQAILLWRIVYTSALRYRERNPEWIFVRHEELSRDPVGEFAALYHRLGLEPTAKARAVIEEHSSSRDPSDVDASAGSEHILRRDSRANMMNWRRRLTPEQIERVRAGVEDVSPAFYAAEDW
jgi:hypothetical protein